MKMDMQKAYDSLKWLFIKQVLRLLGFPEVFVNWIMNCLNTVSYSIVLNGKGIVPFPAKKGLQEGDPISLFLLVLFMEYLNRLLKERKQSLDFRFHPGCVKVGIIHLAFVDDLLLFCRGDVSSLTALNDQFQKFSLASDLKANFQKRAVYFGGVPVPVQQQILDLLGYSKGEFPFRYLGVLLSTK